jgi:hypothetical protein
MEEHLTETGNCIIGVAAEKGCAGLSREFRESLACDDAILVTTLSCGGEEATIRSRGSSQMKLDHPTDLVWRRSSFVCGRTIGILSDHVAATLPKSLINNLATGHEMVVTMTVTNPG